MSSWSAVLGSVAVVTGVPLAIIAGLAASGRRLTRILPILVSFGGGALIGAAVFHLLPEAYARHPTVAFVAVSVVAGIVGSYLLERWLHRWQDTRHEAPPSPGDEVSAFDDPSMVVLNFGADAVHNFLDGALIAAAYLAGGTPGMVVTLTMVAHEVPRELGTFGVFVHYGARPSRAVLFNAITGLFAMAGATLTLLLGEGTAQVAEVVVPFAAGAFLFVGGSVLVSQLKVVRAWELPLGQLVACAAGLALSAVAAVGR
ncbi:MAG: ZIP family metal transporter [Gemmatimonadota bacterium]|nr:ZIP family metal transporter [Gemmatimonadota bacterium]